MFSCCSLKRVLFFTTNCTYKTFLMCLQLELQSTGPSTPSIIVDEEGNIIDSRDGSSEPIQFVFEDIHWASEISRQEAARRLDVTLYPFKKVNVHETFVQHTVGSNTTVSLFSLCSFPGVLPAFFRGL